MGVMEFNDTKNAVESNDFMDGEIETLSIRYVTLTSALTVWRCLPIPLTIIDKGDSIPTPSLKTYSMSLEEKVGLSRIYQD